MLGMEVGDIAQVSTLGFPKAEPEAPLVSLGIGNSGQIKACDYVHWT